jgi:hypothetical protein
MVFCYFDCAIEIAIEPQNEFFFSNHDVNNNG